MTVSERIPFSGLLLPLQEGYTYSCDRRTTDGQIFPFPYDQARRYADRRDVSVGGRNARRHRSADAF